MERRQHNRTAQSLKSKKIQNECLEVPTYGISCENGYRLPCLQSTFIHCTTSCQAILETDMNSVNLKETLPLSLFPAARHRLSSIVYCLSPYTYEEKIQNEFFWGSLIFEDSLIDIQEKKAAIRKSVQRPMHTGKPVMPYHSKLKSLTAKDGVSAAMRKGSLFPSRLAAAIIIDCISQSVQ